MPLLAKVFHPILTSFAELPPVLSLMTKWGASRTHSRLRLLIWQGIAHTFSSWQPWKIYDSVDISPDIKVLVFTFNYQESYFPELKIPTICLSWTLFLISRHLINPNREVVQHQTRSMYPSTFMSVHSKKCVGVSGVYWEKSEREPRNGFWEVWPNHKRKAPAGLPRVGWQPHRTECSPLRDAGEKKKDFFL